MRGRSGAEEWLNDGVFVTRGDTAWLGELLVSSLAATCRTAMVGCRACEHG